MPCFSLPLLLHFFYCRGILSRMDPSERKREGRGNHWRINLHSRAITIGVVRLLTTRRTKDLCLLVSPYLASRLPMRGAKKRRDSSKHCPATKGKQKGHSAATRCGRSATKVRNNICQNKAVVSYSNQPRGLRHRFYFQVRRRERLSGSGSQKTLLGGPRPEGRPRRNVVVLRKRQLDPQDLCGLRRNTRELTEVEGEENFASATLAFSLLPVKCRAGNTEWTKN